MKYVLVILHPLTKLSSTVVLYQETFGLIHSRFRTGSSDDSLLVALFVNKFCIKYRDNF